MCCTRPAYLERVAARVGVQHVMQNMGHQHQRRLNKEQPCEHVHMLFATARIAPTICWLHRMSRSCTLLAVSSSPLGSCSTSALQGSTGTWVIGERASEAIPKRSLAVAVAVVAARRDLGARACTPRGTGRTWWIRLCCHLSLSTWCAPCLSTASISGSGLADRLSCSRCVRSDAGVVQHR